MIVLGFNLGKGDLRWALLTGTIASPVLAEKGRRTFNPDDLSDTCHWFDKNFSELIAQIKPNTVSYRLSWKIKSKAQAGYLVMPFGILHLRCREEKMHCIEHHIGSFTKKRFSFPNKITAIEMCDSMFKPAPPHWDDAQKYAVLAAWAELP
ncbi:MAG: hypothetical protein ABL973_18280 [Micropepsaceae bacterium]